MLQRIHERAQGWFAWVIIGLVCITFALWGIESYLTPGGGDQTVATVGDVELTQQQLNNATERLLQLRQAQMGGDIDVSPQMIALFKQQALEQLVMEAALSQAAVDEGFRVSAEQINQAIMQVPMFQEDGKFSQTQFLNILARMNYSQTEFITLMSSGLLVNQVRMGIVNTAFALADEAKQAIALVDQTRDISYALIPAQQFAKADTVTDVDQQAYYERNLGLFQTPERVSMDYIELSLADVSKRVKVTEQEIEQYYQANLASFSTKARWEVAHILIKYPAKDDSADMDKAQESADNVFAKAKAGEDFAQLAKTYSQDVISAKNGGLLPWFTEGTLDPSFEKAVMSIKKPGEITGPIPTKYGYDIIKLIQTEPAQTAPLTKVRPQIVAALTQQKAEQLFAEDTDQLTSLSYENPNTLTVAAEAVGLPVESTGFFGRQGGDTPITKNSQILNAIFSPEVLQGNNSEVLTVNDSTIAIVRMKKYEAAAPKPFADVQAQIKQTLTQQYASASAAQLGEKLLAELQQGGDTKALMQQNKIEWKKIAQLPRQETTPDVAIVKTAFALPLSTEQASHYQGVALASGDYAIVTVTKVNPGDLEKADIERRKTFYQDLAMGYGLSAYDQYRIGQVKKADVSYEEGVTAPSAADE